MITVERAAIGDRTKTNNYAHAALVWWQFAALRRRVRRCTIEVARGGGCRGGGRPACGAGLTQGCSGPGHGAAWWRGRLGT